MECVTCICVLARGWVGGVGGEKMTGLGLGFTNSGITWGKWDMCLCFGCVGIGGDWVGGLGQGLGGWCGHVCVCCESGLSVLMAGADICILCLADTCAS